MINSLSRYVVYLPCDNVACPGMWYTRPVVKLRVQKRSILALYKVACPGMWYTRPVIKFKCPGMWYTRPVIKFTCPGMWYIRPVIKFTCPGMWYTRPVVKLRVPKRSILAVYKVACPGMFCTPHCGKHTVLVRNTELFPIFISLIPVIYVRISIKTDEQLYLHSKLMIAAS
jgi:hypothetical protein